jgi:hypothetical protein
MPYRGPINRNPGSGEASIIIYNYIPSLALGIVGTVTFVIALFCHLWRLIQGKGRNIRLFAGLFVLGSLMEIVGYAFRIQSHYRPFLVNGFVVQYFMIVCAPVAFAAALYLSLSIALQRTDPNVLPIKPKRIVSIFVTIDVITTILQIAGAALIGTSESARTQGKSSSITPEQANNILLSGLSVQTASFLGFFVLLSLAVFHSFSSRRKESQDNRLPGLFCLVLITSSALIFLRTVFRTAETAQGVFGSAFSSEALFGTLEFLPVILAVGLWAAFPPDKLLAAQGANQDDAEDSRPGASTTKQSEIRE